MVGDQSVIGVEIGATQLQVVIGTPQGAIGERFRFEVSERCPNSSALHSSACAARRPVRSSAREVYEWPLRFGCGSAALRKYAGRNPPFRFAVVTTP